MEGCNEGLLGDFLVTTKVWKKVICFINELGLSCTCGIFKTSRG